MKFTLDSKDILSHLVLDNDNIVDAVGGTKAWRSDGVLEAKLTVNGVDIPAEELDKLLNKMWKLAQVETGAEAFEEAVREEAKERLKAEFGKELDALNRLSRKLEDIDDLLVYSWDK